MINEKDSYCIVMEFCKGKNLLEHIQKNGKFSEEDAVKIFQQLLSVCTYLHSNGISHRDLKPENIILSSDLTAKLIDFGLASSKKSSLSTFCGSPFYASPEVLSETPYHGPSNDMFALGVILFIMVTGTLPWPTHNISLARISILGCTFSIPDYVSPQCSDLISSLIVKNPLLRLSASNALKHRWLRSISDKSKNLPPLPLLSRNHSTNFSETASTLPSLFPIQEENVLPSNQNEGVSIPSEQPIEAHHSSFFKNNFLQSASKSYAKTSKVRSSSLSYKTHTPINDA